MWCANARVCANCLPENRYYPDMVMPRTPEPELMDEAGLEYLTVKTVSDRHLTVQGIIK